ncbi:MAG TPA: hypothetical protein VIM69_10470 [Opitutaceae bacterium]
MSKYELMLHEALASPLGVKVEVLAGERERARQKFYTARAQNLLMFESISIVLDPLVATRLWLLSKGGTSAETE